MDNLSRDTQKIIFNYIDYSLNNLNKKLHPIRINKQFKIKDYITFEDILTLSFKNGHKGFYVNTTSKIIISQIDKMIKPNYINKFEMDSIIYYYINEGDYACSILSFSEILEYIITTNYN